MSSLTAEINAYFRARESRNPQGILKDEWAQRLHPGTIPFQMIRLARFGVPPLGRLVQELQTAHCVRHAAIDHLLLDALRDGFSQVVLLGAGNDMRRARFADVLKDVCFVEVDRPEQLSFKRKFLGTGIPGKSVEVPSDLENPALSRLLERAGISSQQRTFYVMEGVAHYLAEEALARLWSTLGPGRMVVSYIRPEMVVKGEGLFGRLWAMTTEIPRSFFDEEGLRRLGKESGWTLREHWDFRRQVEAFVPQTGGRDCERSQDIALFEKEER